MGRPCDAIAPLELVAARRSGAPDIASFRQRIEMLYVLDECKPLRPTGKATIRFVPGQLATTKVVLNGKTSLQMVVDTGASYVTITRKTAERLGIDVAKLPKVQVATAAGVAGVRTHSRGRLDEVKVQGLTAKNVDLTIADDLGGAEGLLGQSFLARFQITTDTQRESWSSRRGSRGRARPALAGWRASRRCRASRRRRRRARCRAVGRGR